MRWDEWLDKCGLPALIEKQRKQLGYPERLHPSYNRQIMRLENSTELFVTKGSPGCPILMWAQWKDPEGDIMTGLVSELSEGLPEEQWR